MEAAPEIKKPSTSGFDAPPPPSEVRVRTMQTDIESVSRGGGMSASPEAERIEVRIPRARTVFPEPEDASGSGVVSRTSPRLLIALGTAAFLLAAGFFGYYAYSFLISRNAPSPPSTGEEQPLPPPAPNIPPAVPPAPQGMLIEHQSFFRVPADRSFELTFSKGPVASASELQTYGQRLTAAVLAFPAAQDFFEVLLVDGNTWPISVSDFFSAANINLVRADTLSESFRPDVTAFVYRNKQGLWPGYVLSIKSTATAAVLQQSVKDHIERSADLTALFVSTPLGAGESFRGKNVSGRPVRYLSFTSPAGAEFSYAWLNDNLIFATNEAALVQAFEHIGR